MCGVVVSAAGGARAGVAAPAGRVTTWVEQAVRTRFPGRGVLVTVDAGRLVCAVSTSAGVPRTKGPDRLLLTLEAYFGAGGNTAAAARALHVRVRALSYLLQRGFELTGDRAGDPAHSLPLHVVVTGARLLGWPDRPPSAP